MKKIFFLIMVAMILFLSSCSAVGRFAPNNGRDADNRMEQLLGAIENQNKDTLRAAFSNLALSESEDFDSQVKRLFEFFQGTVVSWARDGEPPAGGEVSFGRRTRQIRAWFEVNTTIENYLIFLIDYTVDTINPENAGLYMLKIIRAEDEHQLEGAWQDWATPGIIIGLE